MKGLQSDMALEQIENYTQLKQLFELQRAYVMRKKIHFSFVFIHYEERLGLPYDHLYEQINSQLRNSDFIFKEKGKRYFILMLSISKVRESNSFLQRLEKVLTNVTLPIRVVITEVATAKPNLDDILLKSFDSLKELEERTEDIIVVQDFLQVDNEVVKVSILENDTVALSIFQNIFENMKVPQLDLEVKTFVDGKDFIDSDWYWSGHHHIILINDLLPRKNGFEILHHLRSLPNNQKYLIYFISARIAEEAQLNALENGADAYFMRPFNLKILEVQLKNYLKRLQ